MDKRKYFVSMSEQEIDSYINLELLNKNKIPNDELIYEEKASQKEEIVKSLAIFHFLKRLKKKTN